MWNGALGAGPGWVEWLLTALVLAALWAVPVAGIFALFRATSPGHPHIRGRRRGGVGNQRKQWRS